MDHLTISLFSNFFSLLSLCLPHQLGPPQLCLCFFILSHKKGPFFWFLWWFSAAIHSLLSGSVSILSWPISLNGKTGNTALKCLLLMGLLYEKPHSHSTAGAKPHHTHTRTHKTPKHWAKTHRLEGVIGLFPGSAQLHFEEGDIILPLRKLLSFPLEVSEWN